MTSFERFGDNFQSKILHHIITDKIFALQVLEILDPDFFSNEKYVELATQIVKWNETYGTTPTFDNLETIIKTEYEDEIEREFKTYPINNSLWKRLSNFVSNEQWKTLS